MKESDAGFGETYWSLANIKTFRFTAADMSATRAQLARPAIDDVNGVHLHFALGKACEDAGDHAQAFEHYATANALHRAGHPYDADLNSNRVRRLKTTFTREFFGERAGSGCDAPDPIFSVGIPRAGSTLLEQILSSHSAVVGTMELPRSSPWPRNCAPRPIRRQARCMPRCWPRRAPANCVRWGNSTSSARASTARPRAGRGRRRRSTCAS